MLVTVVETAATHAFAAFLQDPLGFVEENFRDDAFVPALIDCIAPADFSDVSRILDHVQDHPLVPLLPAALAVPRLVHLVADRMYAFPAECVHLKPLPD